MSDVAEQIKDGSNIILTASPFSNIGKQDVLKSAVDVPATAYRMCNPSSHNIPLTQFTPIGNSIKPGIPKLSAHEVGDELNICPVILHPSKQLGSQVQMKSDGLIKTIGFAPARSQMTAQAQNRIVTTSMQRSIMESQNVSPLIITPTSHVIHSSNEVVPAKIVPIPSTPAVSHFSVINKTGSYDSIPEYTGIRQSLVPGTPPVYTQSDFARFPPKSYHHKNAVVNPAVIHGPIPGNIDEPCINIPNSQHVFKPIISPRPSILRKRDADGVLRAQKNLIPILTKPDIEECQNTDETSLNRNGYSETGLQLDSLVVPQIPEVRLLPQISALNKQSHIMVEISPRKKPRKQLLPVNQEDSPFKIVGDDMEYVEEKSIKNDKSEDFTDEVFNCNDDLIDGDAEDEAEDDLDDMDVDDDCPADDDYDDDDDDFGNDFGDEFDYVKSDKTFFEENKTPAEVSDESSACVKPKNKRPTLLGSYKNTWRGGNSHHFQRHIDFKVKETKKQLADMQQAKKWTSDSISGWRVRHLLDQFDEMINIEDDIITRMTELMSGIEANVKDLRQRHNLIELVKDNIQRSKVSRAQLDEIRQQLKKIFDYKSLIEDVVDKYCPKDLKKKYAKVFNLSKS
uniref:Histone deacetylase complex subunit SAP130 n=1 Tax=Melanaphis sacchari TaxID=742174 RepID=A0A2H8TIU5_9HEMI